MALGEKDIERTPLRFTSKASRKKSTSSEKFRLMPGVPAILDACLEAGHRLGLATGTLEEGARIKLERARLWHYFEFGGYGSDAADRTEMTRAAVRKARAAVGEDVPSERIYVIGDTPHDILCAHEAGVRAVGVGAARFTCGELAHHHPELLLEDLSRAEEFLGGIV
jgi:phosphoglycolate phosphatase-like HAD superfamily hydrolase